MSKAFLRIIILVCLLYIVGLSMTGCGLTPTYSVRVDNQSARTVLARIERRPSMNNMVMLDSARVRSESDVQLGPVEAPPLERVYIVIQSSENLHSVPESHKISRGNWVVTITDGSVSTWGAYEISVRKE